MPRRLESEHQDAKIGGRSLDQLKGRQSDLDALQRGRVVEHSHCRPGLLAARLGMKERSVDAVRNDVRRTIAVLSPHDFIDPFGDDNLEQRQTLGGRAAGLRQPLVDLVSLHKVNLAPLARREQRDLLGCLPTSRNGHVRVRQFRVHHPALGVEHSLLDTFVRRDRAAMPDTEHLFT